MALFHHIGWLRHIGIFTFLEKIDFFANNVNEIGFEKATEVKYPKAEGSAIKQKWTKQEEELLIREYSKGL